MTILGYTLALVLAVTVLGAVFSREISRPDWQQVVELSLAEADDSEKPTLLLSCPADGEILFRHSPVGLVEGDTAHLVVSKTRQSLLIKEKLGVSSRGENHAYAAQGHICGIPAQGFDVRFESEITGQWATASLSCTGGSMATPELLN